MTHHGPDGVYFAPADTPTPGRTEKRGKGLTDQQAREALSQADHYDALCLKREEAMRTHGVASQAYSDAVLACLDAAAGLSRRLRTVVEAVKP